MGLQAHVHGPSAVYTRYEGTFYFFTILNYLELTHELTRLKASFSVCHMIFLSFSK